jgi:hypothetical protein
LVPELAGIHRAPQSLAARAPGITATEKVMLKAERMDILFDGKEITFAAGPYGVYRFDADVFNLLSK